MASNYRKAHRYMDGLGRTWDTIHSFRVSVQGQRCEIKECDAERAGHSLWDAGFLWSKVDYMDNTFAWLMSWGSPSSRILIPIEAHDEFDVQVCDFETPWYSIKGFFSDDAVQTLLEFAEYMANLEKSRDEGLK